MNKGLWKNELNDNCFKGEVRGRYISNLILNMVMRRKCIYEELSVIEKNNFNRKLKSGFEREDLLV